ncbi:unnamed protein product [Brassica rapa]|uniref:Uncharacterized protein n=2 Tax=Brassica TaxID=3705 RepID=A0A8D9CTB6_BRACM|nr:unnamed protein product [Brassica napus]CAG7862398.1 unnamed protein product [Brassica rapa]
MWLSPATLELYHITWDDSASLLENIVAYEAVTSYQQPFGSQKKIRNRSSMQTFATLSPIPEFMQWYLLQEEESGKALDSVANFHLQNVAVSQKSIHLSGGIVVKYVYRLENIEYYA